MKPAPFAVEYFDFTKAAAVKEREGTLDLAGPDELYTQRGFASEDEARAFVTELEAIEPRPPWWRVWRRHDFIDATPPEDGRGLVWDYEETIHAECEDEESDSWLTAS